MFGAGTCILQKRLKRYMHINLPAHEKTKDDFEVNCGKEDVISVLLESQLLALEHGVAVFAQGWLTLPKSSFVDTLKKWVKIL